MQNHDWPDTLFTQSPPTLGNQFDDDPLLGSWLKRALPASTLAALHGELRELGALAGGELYRLQLADLASEPVLTQWDAWGRRIDQVAVTPLWSEAERLSAKHGLVATAYEPELGRYARVAQFLRRPFRRRTDERSFPPRNDRNSCPGAIQMRRSARQNQLSAAALRNRHTLCRNAAANCCLGISIHRLESEQPATIKHRIIVRR